MKGGEIETVSFETFFSSCPCEREHNRKPGKQASLVRVQYYHSSTVVHLLHCFSNYCRTQLLIDADNIKIAVRTRLWVLSMVQGRWPRSQRFGKKLRRIPWAPSATSGSFCTTDTFCTLLQYYGTTTTTTIVRGILYCTVDATTALRYSQYYFWCQYHAVS